MAGVASLSVTSRVLRGSVVELSVSSVPRVVDGRTFGPLYSAAIVTSTTQPICRKRVKRLLPAVYVSVT